MIAGLLWLAAGLGMSLWAQQVFRDYYARNWANDDLTTTVMATAHAAPPTGLAWLALGAAVLCSVLAVLTWKPRQGDYPSPSGSGSGSGAPG